MPRINRLQDRIDELFPGIVRRWLVKLSPDGFTGTTGELWDSMVAVVKPYDAFPRPNALLRTLDAHADIVTAAGFVVRHQQTARARLVRVEPIVPAGTHRPAA